MVAGKFITAVYAGSFDPFTLGHLDIVREAAAVFQNVYIVISHNSEKSYRHYNAHVMAEAIKKVLLRENLTNCEVEVSDKLIVDFCESVGANYLVRGLRSTTDYLYEENIAKINRQLNPSVSTIYFRAINDTMSSSMVRELMSYDKDISQFVPPEVLCLMSKRK